MVAVAWTTIHHKEASSMAHVRVLGMDLAKQMFPVVGMDDTGTVVWRKRLLQRALRSFIAQRPPVVIGMEAYGGAHD
jgi:transposase